MRSVSSAFWAAMQTDALVMCELIDLTTRNNTYRWCTNNQPIVSSGYTFDPFPGGSEQGAEESTTLAIGTVNFTVANTGNLTTLLSANAMDRSEVYVRRVFVDSPDLGALPVFRGELADFTRNRLAISGQARNLLQSAGRNWPIYTYLDTCVWRFGSTGCGFNTSSVTVTTSLNVSSSTPIVLRATSGSLVGSYAPGQLERGRVTILSGANSGQVRTVRVSTGDLMALSHSLPFPVSGDTMFSIYPGCRKRFIDDCTSKYNNANRFLGVPWMPKQEQAF